MRRSQIGSKSIIDDEGEARKSAHLCSFTERNEMVIQGLCNDDDKESESCIEREGSEREREGIKFMILFMFIKYTFYFLNRIYLFILVISRLCLFLSLKKIKLFLFFLF
jgi:hypothetical protein